MGLLYTFYIVRNSLLNAYFGTPGFIVYLRRVLNLNILAVPFYIDSVYTYNLINLTTNG